MSRMSVWLLYSIFIFLIFWINDRLSADIGFMLGSIVGAGTALAIHWEVNRKIIN